MTLEKLVKTLKLFSHFQNYIDQYQFNVVNFFIVIKNF